MLSSVKSFISQKLRIDEREQRELNDQLWRASNCGDNEAVIKLIHEGADINYCKEDGSDGGTVLGVAAAKGHTNTVQLLISRRELDINKRDGLWRNALHWSCLRGHIDCAKLLINAGIDLQVTDRSGDDAVLCACKSGSVLMLELLLSHGLSLSSVNSWGDDAVLYACESGSVQMLEFLLSHGLSLSSVNNLGNDAVLYACKSGSVQMLKLLLSHGLSLSSVNKNGDNAVLCACESGSVQMLELLLSHGLSLSSVNKLGQNAMHIACMCNHIDMIKYLMKRGSFSLDSPPDRHDRTPKYLSKTKEHVQQFLQELELQDNTETPLATESTDSAKDDGSHQDPYIDYAPYLAKAASKGTVITRQSSLGLCGAAGTGKSSMLRLLTGEPPIYEHDSTPIVKPEEYYSVHSHEWSSDREHGQDNEWNSDEESDQASTQSTAKQQPSVTPMRRDLLISNESTEWNHVTQEVLMKRLANCTLTVYEQENMANGAEDNYTCLLKGFALTKEDDQQIQQDSKHVETKPIELGTYGPSSATSESSSSTCNEISQKILELVESVKSLNKPLGITHFISTCDTGGQAAFIDIAPAFIGFNSVNLILLKLDENLDDPAQFFYSVKGVRVGDEQRQISTRALVYSFISSKSNIRKPSIKGVKVVQQPQKPKFMILGTHFDKYKKKIGKCQSKEDKNCILKQDLAAFGDCLCTNSKSKVMFSLNTLERNETAKKLASKIRELVMQNYIEAEIPVSWYIFQLAMYEIKITNNNQGMIHLTTLIEIGIVSKMPRKEVEACLLYFHDLQVCLYFPTVVPNVVFTDPQFLFDKISEIIAFTFNTSNVKMGTTEGELQKLAKCGIITEAFLKRNACTGFKDGFFTAKDFLSLMNHLFVVCSLPNTDEYFMPCVLATHPNPCKDISKCLVKPLALTWDKSVPNGLFPSLTTKIQSLNGIYFTMSQVEQQFRNKITLVCHGLACRISLIECTSFIAIFVTIGNSCLISEVPHRYIKIRGAVLSCIKDIVKRLDWSPSLAEPKEVFICDICSPTPPDNSSSSSIHVCYCDDTRTVLYCDITNSTTPLTTSYSIWWKDSHNATSTYQNVNNQLLDVDTDCNEVVKALRSIHYKWNTLGVYLDIPDSTIKLIAVKYQSNADPFKQMSDLISTWLRRPTPDHQPCWRRLCQALADMGEVTLAETIAQDHS